MVGFPIRFVDYFVVVSHSPPLSFEPNQTLEGDLTKLKLKCGVLDRYPSKDHDKECVIPANFPMFCFPAGYFLRYHKLTQPVVHPFVLTHVDGTRMYCVCLTFDEQLATTSFNHLLQQNPTIRKADLAVYASTSICILSHYPLYSVFTQFLVQLYRLASNGGAAPIERWVQNFALETPLPPPGKIAVNFKMDDIIIQCTRPTLNSLPLSDVPIEILFRALDHNNILLAWCAALLEYKMVLHSKHPALLAIACESLTSLLFPFHWLHIYIPLLPVALSPYVHCPCPYIIGINVEDIHTIDIPKETMVIDLDNNQITMGDTVLPPLPEPQKIKLLKKLKISANVFERKGDLDNAFDFTSHFLKRATVTSTHKKTPKNNNNNSNHNHNSTNFNEVEVRHAFLQVFVSVFKKYRKFMLKEKNEKGDLFDLKPFIAQQDTSAEPFLTRLGTETQGFLQFVAMRAQPQSSTHEVVLFDEYIIQKRNREKPLFKKETPFLADTSHNVVRTFDVPLVDLSKLDKNFFKYERFPRLNPDLFGTPRHVNPLVDKETGAQRANLVNKEFAIMWDIINSTSPHSSHISPAPNRARRFTMMFHKGKKDNKDYAALWSKKQLGKKYEQAIKNVIQIEAHYKRKRAQQEYTLLRASSIPIQMSIRGCVARLNFLNIQRAALLIQTVWRAKEPRVQYLQEKQASITLQACIRKQRDLAAFKRTKQSSITLQTLIRTRTCRVAYERVRNASTCLQTLCRSRTDRTRYVALQNAADVVQTNRRCCADRTRLVVLREAALALQTRIRKHNEEANFRRLQKSAIALQTLIRTHTCRSAYNKLRNASICLQTISRSCTDRARYVALREAADVLQAHIRTVAPRRYFVAVQKHLVFAQSIVRRHLVKRQIKDLLKTRFVDVQRDLLVLWEKEAVTWLRRAAFMLTFNSITISNLMVHVEEQKRLSSGGSSSSSSSSPPTAKKQTQPTYNTITEKKEIYKILRGYHPTEEGGINQVYIKWGVDPTGKKRKQFLLQKVFADTNDYNKAMESAVLVGSVTGILKTCEHNAMSSKRIGLKEFDQFLTTTSQSVNEKAKHQKGGSCTIL